MRKVFKSTLSLVAGAALVAGVVVTPSLSSAWGDNTGGRRSYTLDQINHGVLGNKIVFNSISDSVIGDEKNFVGARENTGINAGIDNVWFGNDITVENGKEYLIRLYVHNNNPNGRDAVSHNTRVAFNLPTISSASNVTEGGTQVQVNGFIFSDNASPSEYWDYVNFNSDHAFHLEYVYGSALLENRGIGKANYDANGKYLGGGKKLSDNIVTKAQSEHGVQIGYDSLNGEIPGCYGYASYVSIRVKVVFDNDFTVTQKVRLEGEKEWKDNVTAKVGDIVEYKTTYLNTDPDKKDQTNVMVRNVLPNNVEYIAGSTKLYNATYPSGAVVNQDNVKGTGINIGHYTFGSNAHVVYKAKVVDKNLQPGSNTLVNWGKATAKNKALLDYATVTVQKAGTTPVAQEYNVRVNYVYADTGKTAATSYAGKYQSGDQFEIKSPVISGYTASQTVIKGQVNKSDLTYTVKYTRIPKEYTVQVNYIYEDGGATAAPSVSRTYKENTSFNIASPKINGYTASMTSVQGTVVDRNLTYTVKYAKDIHQYRVRINYVYEDGSKAADTYDVEYTEGTSFKVDSPVIAGYTPNYPSVSGKVVDRDLEITVTYKKDPEPVVEPDDPTPEPEPDPTPETPKEIPNTGPEALAGSVIALGSLATSAGYYAASRKSLRK